MNDNTQMNEQNIKACSLIITKVKRNSNAGPFLKPVDPIVLGIPDYTEKIKHPMDISTIKKKLDTKAYKTLEQFNSDFKLMFSNCYDYNLPEAQVYVMGKDLEAAYDGFYEELISTKRKLPEAKETAKKQAVCGKHDQDHCSSILNEILKARYKKFTWPFLEAVSEDEVPGYYDVIKSPMDLGTIQKKLENGEYTGVEDFKEDLQLIVGNCKIFNPPGTEVYKCGEELEKLVKELFSGDKGIDTKINALRKQISSLMDDLKRLEEQSKFKGKIYSLSEREQIGNSVLDMSSKVDDRIAEIVQRKGCYEYIDDGYIEFNIHTIPDEVIGEIEEFVKREQGGKISMEEHDVVN